MLIQALPGDAGIQWVQQIFGPELRPVLRLLSLPGGSWGILLAVALGAWWLGGRSGLAVAVGTALAAPVRVALAAIAAVPRPDRALALVETPEIGSFPSGHVLHAVVAWGILAGTTRFPAWLAALLAVGTAVSRVYLGVHFPADVLASLVLGPLLVWGFLRLWPRLDRRLRSAPGGAWTAAATVGGAALLVVAALTAPDRPQQWEAVGLLAGGIAVLGAHGLWPASRTSPGPRGRTAWIGLPGLFALALTARVLWPELVWVAGAAAAAAVVWIFRGAPALAGRGAGDR